MQTPTASFAVVVKLLEEKKRRREEEEEEQRGGDLLEQTFRRWSNDLCVCRRVHLKWGLFAFHSVYV